MLYIIISKGREKKHDFSKVLDTVTGLSLSVINNVGGSGNTFHLWFNILLIHVENEVFCVLIGDIR